MNIAEKILELKAFFPNAKERDIQYIVYLLQCRGEDFSIDYGPEAYNRKKGISSKKLSGILNKVNGKRHSCTACLGHLKDIDALKNRKPEYLDALSTAAFFRNCGYSEQPLIHKFEVEYEHRPWLKEHREKAIEESQNYIIKSFKTSVIS